MKVANDSQIPDLVPVPLDSTESFPPLQCENLREESTTIEEPKSMNTIIQKKIVATGMT